MTPFKGRMTSFHRVYFTSGRVIFLCKRVDEDKGRKQRCYVSANIGYIDLKCESISKGLKRKLITSAQCIMQHLCQPHQKMRNNSKWDFGRRNFFIGSQTEEPRSGIRPGVNPGSLPPNYVHLGRWLNLCESQFHSL